MSERAARSCNGKIWYNSQRRASAAAKASQIVYGIPINEYLCDICKKWHCGSTYPQNARAERMKKEESGEAQSS